MEGAAGVEEAQREAAGAGGQGQASGAQSRSAKVLEGKKGQQRWGRKQSPGPGEVKELQGGQTDQVCNRSLSRETGYEKTRVTKNSKP
jgi:hypothetical protein